MADPHREFKDRLYGQFARLGKALSNPHRLEMLELLAQGERTVDSLATEIGLSLANASQHLQALRQSALVESRKDGLFVYYRLALSAVLVRETQHHVAHESTLLGAMPADGLLSARQVFWRTSVLDRNLSSVSQAGLVNNLNDGMA